MEKLSTDLGNLQVSEIKDQNPLDQTPPVQTLEQSATLSAKQLKKNMTAYWGVALSNDVFENELIKSFLEEHKELVPLKKIHSTLLYVGKKENPLEETYKDLEGIECTLIIPGYGYSENAMAFKVDGVTYIGADNMTVNVQSFAVQQHVTMALKAGTKAVDSVKTLLGEGTFVEFPETLKIAGHIKRYLF